MNAVEFEMRKLSPKSYIVISGLGQEVLSNSFLHFFISRRPVHPLKMLLVGCAIISKLMSATYDLSSTASDCGADLAYLWEAS